jgi:hypothetical protein
VSQTSFWWKQLIYFLENLLDAKLQQKAWQVFDRIPSLSLHQLRKIGSWLIFSIAIVMMWLWNWKLILATAVGIGLMFFVYFLPSKKLHAYWLRWQKFFQGDRRKLTLAVGGGGIAAFSTYMAASIWAESENRWLATAIIGQSLATIITLVLLIWNLIRDRVDRDNNKFDRLLSELSESDPLKRLIAVRQLTRLVRKANCEYTYQLIEYFRILLSQEKEAIVREAILESLQIWDIQELKAIENNSLQIPLTFKVSQQRIYH